MGLHSGWVRRYLQTLEKAGKACKRQSLLPKIVNYGRKKFDNIGSRSNICDFLSVLASTILVTSWCKM